LAKNKYANQKNPKKKRKKDTGEKRERERERERAYGCKGFETQKEASRCSCGSQITC
jgi:hypothetical protein